MPRVTKTGTRIASKRVKKTIEGTKAVAEALFSETQEEVKLETTAIKDTKPEPATTESTKGVKRKRKTKDEQAAEALPLAARTLGSKVVVGAHVSAAGGVQNAVTNSIHIGGNAFALFLKSQRKWANPPLKPEQITLYHANCKHHSVSSDKHVVPHGSYLVNLAHVDSARATQAYDSFTEDLGRCNTLGIQLYNIHPGNAASTSRDEAVKQLARQLNKANKDPITGTVVTLLETMATSGNTIGTTFEELAAIIHLVEDKSRIGVCLDTCHVFAAGYDLRTPLAFQSTMTKFDELIGLKYLKAFHVNDSKAPFASGRDLHANIGTGFLGLRSFHNLMNDSRLWGIPLILETPIDIKGADGKTTEDQSVWAREIKLLESLVGMDADSKEFQNLEEALQRRGDSERKRVQDQVDRKKEKDSGKKTAVKKTAVKKAAVKKKAIQETSDSDSE